MSPEQLAKHIRGLSVADTAQLVRLLGWDTPPPIGTREPRRPRGPQLRGSIALDEPADRRKASP